MFKIKLSGIYKIEHISGYYYIGKSINIFSRWNSHYTQIKINKHSSTKFKDLWNSTSINEWNFSILEYVSLSQFREENNVKGKVLTKAFNTYLLQREKYWMSLYSINYSLNKIDRYFS
jgi:hypothetical protein